MEWNVASVLYVDRFQDGSNVDMCFCINTPKKDDVTVHKEQIFQKM